MGGGGLWGVTVGKGRLRLLPTNSTSPALFWTFEDTRWADMSTVWSQEGFLGRRELGDSRGMLVSLPTSNPDSPPQHKLGAGQPNFCIYIQYQGALCQADRKE